MLWRRFGKQSESGAVVPDRILERLAVVETRQEHLEEKVEDIVTSRATRAKKKKAVILAGLGLVGTVSAKNLGFM